MAKTDRIDAAVIAHFAQTFSPPIRHSDPVADLRRFETPAPRQRAERRLRALRAEAKQIEAEMRAIVDGDPAKKPLFAPPHEIASLRLQ